MNPPTKHTVVVGVDETPDAERALLYGVALASREDLDLRLVHVPHEIEFLAPMLPYVPMATPREIGEAVLEEAAKLAEKEGFDAERISTVLARGPRSAALLRQTSDARCIVLGTRASILQHFVTGATSRSVAAHSSVPVHCVPPGWSMDRHPSGRVVVGVDGSAADGEVLREAFTEASARGAFLEVVHAWRPEGLYDAAISGRVLREDWSRTERDALTRVIEEVAADHDGVGWMLRLEFEGVSVALHEAALKADLLVLGRHGHRARLALLVGSNTRTVLHAATCPVLVVPVSSEDD